MTHPLLNLSIDGLLTTTRSVRPPRNVISLIAEAVGVQREDRFRKYNTCHNVDEVLVEAREYIEAGDYSVEEMRKILPGQLKILQGQG